MYTVLDENLQVKGRLSLNNGNGATAFFSDTITTQMATDNANDPTGLTTVDYTNQDKQGNAKQWSHSLTVNVEATELGTSINTTDYLMYFDSVANHYYSMKVINATTDRNSGFITVSAINAAIFELGKQLVQAEQVYKQVDLKTFVSKMYKNAPFSLRIADDNLVTLDYTVSANTSLQALLQDLQTKFDVDVDSWVEVDKTGHIVDRVLYFGHLGTDNGELIRYGGAKGFENMTATEVSDIIYTKLYVTGKTDDKDPSKGHIGAVNNGLEYITDDDANQLMYAIGASQQQPVYLEGTITNNLLSEPKALLEWAKQQMGIFNHPRFNYTVSPLHDQIVAIGDTVSVQDFHVKPEILVTSKVIQKTTSFASPETNTFVLGEFSSIFTDNMNKGANVITLIKKDVIVVQEAADYAKAQADAAHAQAVIAQEQAIHAQTTANGKLTGYTADSVEDLPATANNGDIAWVTLNDGTHGYTYLNGKWVEDLNPTLQKDITDGVNKATSDAKAYADQAIATNGNNVSASIKAVNDKADQLKADQTTFDNKAQGYANQAKTDAEANTAAVQQQLQKAISDGDTGLQTQITSNKEAIALTATKTELNDAKTDYNAQIASVNVKADSISNTVAQVSGKVDGIEVGGRNLFAWSKTLPWGFGANSNATVTVEDFDANTKMYHIKSDKGHGQSAGMYIWGFCTDRGLPKGSNWSFSADIKGTGYINNFGAEGSTNVVTKGAIGTDWSRLSQSGVANNADHISLIMYFDTDKSAVDVYIKLPKLEIGNMSTAYTQAPEDIDEHFSTQQQTIDSINSTVVQQGTDINKVSTRVQTAEGEISTAQDNISGLQYKQTQTADGLSQEVSDRKSGDNNTLQLGKDFTTSQISNSETGMKSFVNQTISGLQIGAISSDVNALKLSTQWQTVNVDDLNNMTNQGKFFIQGGNHTNAPVGGWFYLTVDKPINGRITQVAWADSNPTMQYTRILFGSNWSNWNRVVTNETVLSIFNDSWSLGTSANDGITKKLITGINGQADGTLVVSGKSVILNSDTVLGNNFIIGSAQIANGAIGTAQIGDAAITSAKIANLDVSKLTGDTITGFNINANRQIKIASGGALISDVVNMDKTNFSVSAPNISSYRFSSEKYKVSTSNGIFNINSVLGVFSSDGNISVAVDTNTDPYKKGVFHSEYGGNNLMMSATNYTNGDPDEQLNMSSARLDYMYSKTGFLSDATDHTSIRANLIETTGTLNAFSGAQIPNIYSYPNLILESKNQSVYFRSGGDYRLQIRENGYIYLWNKKFGSGGSSLQVAGDGALFIQSSATKFKEDIQYDGGTSVGDKFLTLDPATWQDKSEYEARAEYRKIGTEPDHQIHMDDKRYYGLIAEDLVKAGLEEFVVRDENTGEVNGLEYDKVAISMIPVIRSQRDAINELKAEVERLKDKVK